MQGCKTLTILLGACWFLAVGAQNARSQDKPASGTVQVHVVITDEALQADKELPPLQREDVKVKQGKNFLSVTQVIPADGANAALQLMILIDDTLNTSIGNNVTDLKNFISAQSPSTVIGVGYMSPDSAETPEAPGNRNLAWADFLRLRMKAAVSVSLSARLNWSAFNHTWIIFRRCYPTSTT